MPKPAGVGWTFHSVDKGESAMAQRIPVERLVDLEQKHGVTISATGFLEYDRDEREYIVKVIGEVTGGPLRYDLDMIISVYNPQGEIIGTETCYIMEDSFEGIESFDGEISIPDGEQVGIIRVYPKKG
jgi:hypothetical protein